MQPFTSFSPHLIFRVFRVQGNCVPCFSRFWWQCDLCHLLMAVSRCCAPSRLMRGERICKVCPQILFGMLSLYFVRCSALVYPFSGDVCLLLLRASLVRELGFFSMEQSSLYAKCESSRTAYCMVDSYLCFDLILVQPTCA